MASIISLSAPASNPVTSILIGDESFTCRSLNIKDGTQLLELHQLVFGKPLDMQWLKWKYLDHANPSMGLWNSEGVLIAHCGGIARKVNEHHVSLASLQICDVMVHPNWRGILSRRGPFFWISQQFYQQHIGANRPYQLGYGFPSLRHLELAQKLNLLSNAGSIWELNWERPLTAINRHPWYWQVMELEEGSALWQQYLGQAWSIMRAASIMVVTGDRSINELDWRYRQHPHHKHFYTALKRPWSRSVRGVAIWRYTDSGTILWLDWIGAPSDLPRAQRMLAQRLAQPQARLQTWGSELIRMALKDTPGYSERIVARIGVPVQSRIAQNDLDAVPWWWMAGDTDFL